MRRVLQTALSFHLAGIGKSCTPGTPGFDATKEANWATCSRMPAVAVRQPDLIVAEVIVRGRRESETGQLALVQISKFLNTFAMARCAI